MRIPTAATTETDTAPAGRFTARRRSLVAAAAWSAPVVAVASAAPAFAASQPTASPMSTYSLASAAAGTGIVPVIERCTTVPAGTVTFAGSFNGAPAPVGEIVRVSLPAGLAFAAGGQDADVRITQAGLVQVPAFTANGAAGTYSVTASMRGQVAVQSVTVVPAPGAVVELRRSTTTTATSAVFSTLAVAATLQFSGAPVAGAQFLDTWTSTGAGQATTADATGGVAASASTIWTWRLQGSSSTVARVTGLSGAVQASPPRTAGRTPSPPRTCTAGRTRRREPPSPRPWSAAPTSPAPAPA